MNRSHLILVGGGGSSGKTAFSLNLAKRLGPRRTYIATAEAKDKEMENKIARHRIERGSEFETIEAPLALSETVSSLSNTDVVVVDCLTLWLTNLLLRDETQAQILRKVECLANLAQRSAFPIILITNEVGMGLIPESSLGRSFRDLTGRTHQKFGDAAEEIYFTLLGSVFQIKPMLRPAGEGLV